MKNERTEQALSNQVMNYLSLRGILHYRVRNTGTIIHRRGGGLVFGRDRYRLTQRGTPDILAWKDGVSYAFELKSPDGNLRPEQKAWLDLFIAQGGIGRVVRSLDDVTVYFEGK